MSKVEVVILAAGQGTRMNSNLPKVLHEVGGRPLLQHVIDTAVRLESSRICVVYGHGGDKVIESLKHNQVSWVEQKEQLGTGHAVEQALPYLGSEATVLILYGDVPLTKKDTLQSLIAASEKSGIALLTVKLKDPTGYGRIVRDNRGQIKRIVEEKDADELTRLLPEGNSGMLALKASLLYRWINKLENNNAQGEFYLTDIIAMAVADGIVVESVISADEDEVLGVNDRRQQSHLEKVYQQRVANTLLMQGVTLINRDTLNVKGMVRAGKDVIIDMGVTLEGNVFLGDNIKIGANCILKNVEIGDGTEILPMSIIENAKIGMNCTVGPFARIRPDTMLMDGARVGNFVEVKKSVIGEGSKVNHLSYIGDTDMGRNVNIGAGTITCNYDGANKHKTTIGDNAFIGSDSQLVAPVTIGEDATIGAGSTISKDAPNGKLSLTRAKQETISGWKRPKKDN